MGPAHIYCSGQGEKRHVVQTENTCEAQQQVARYGKTWGGGPTIEGSSTAKKFQINHDFLMDLNVFFHVFCVFVYWFFDILTFWGNWKSAQIKWKFFESFTQHKDLQKIQKNMKIMKNTKKYMFRRRSVERFSLLYFLKTVKSDFLKSICRACFT